MSDVTLRRRIAVLVMVTFLSVMGMTVAAATVVDSAEALRCENCWEIPPREDI